MGDLQITYKSIVTLWKCWIIAAAQAAVEE